MQRVVDKSDRKAAKKAKKSAKKEAAALDGNNANSNSANNDKNADAAGKDNAKDTNATAVANALALHPQVDLDVALQNHHATAGIPKQNLTHEKIYDAITAEANFQKRQAIIQRRLRPENPDAPEDSGAPNARSP